MIENLSIRRLSRSVAMGIVVFFWHSTRKSVSLACDGSKFSSQVHEFENFLFSLHSNMKSKECIGRSDVEEAATRHQRVSLPERVKCEISLTGFPMQSNFLPPLRRHHNTVS